MALVAVTVNVDEPPAVIEAGLAARVTVGMDGVVTVTITWAEAAPPVPVALAV
jgi:hypothetical protein